MIEDTSGVSPMPDAGTSTTMTSDASAAMPDTPRRLPTHAPRRRTSDQVRAWPRVVFALIGLLSTLGGGYWSGLQAVGDRERSLLERIVRLETARESDYKAIMARLDDLKERQDQVRQDTRADVNGIRDEILRILRNQR